MRLKQLRQKAADLTREARALVDGASAANRDLTAEERTRRDAIFAELDTVSADIKAEERLLDEERARSTVADTSRPTPAASVQVRDRAEDDPWAGFQGAADFGVAVRMACIPGGRVDPRLAQIGRNGVQAAAPSNPHTEAGNAEGWMVPAALSNRVFELIFSEDGLVQAMDPEPTDSNAVDIEADETTPWGSVGVRAFWRGENTAMTGTKTVVAPRTVRLHELYAFVSATEELLEDAPRLENRLTRKSAAAITWKAEEAIFAGTGAGQPLGWKNAPGSVTQAAEGGQTATTIVTNNVTKMYSRLIAAGGAPFWLANRDTVPQLVALAIGNQPIYTPPNAGIREAPGGMLMGYPIKFSEHAETLGAVGDLSLVNPAGYYAAIKRGGVKFASSIHLYFDYNATAYRWTFRLGGQPYLSAPMAAAKGSNSKSHFVMLAAR
jgi:HK97 family phage major capsid protein